MFSAALRYINRAFNPDDDPTDGSGAMQTFITTEPSKSSPPEDHTGHSGARAPAGPDRSNAVVRTLGLLFTNTPIPPVPTRMVLVEFLAKRVDQLLDQVGEAHLVGDVQTGCSFHKKKMFHHRSSSVAQIFTRAYAHSRLTVGYCGGRYLCKVAGRVDKGRGSCEDSNGIWK